MSKYTEDNLREELKTKEYEYGFYTRKLMMFKQDIFWQKKDLKY